MASKNNNKNFISGNGTLVTVIVFVLIFIYMLFSVFRTKDKEETSYFEVQSSKYENDFTETGLAIRSEKFDYAKEDGYICYYIRDGERVAKNANVYSVDATGSMNEALNDLQNSNTNLLSKDEMKEISDMIKLYKIDINESSFSQVYDFKTSIDNKVLELYEELALEQLTTDKSFKNTFSTSTSENSGIITYYSDGFEDYDISKISSDDFDKTDYEKVTLKKKDIVNKGDPVYKIVDSEEWKIVVLVNDEEYKKITSSDFVRFTINDCNKRVYTKYETIEKGDDKYIVITLLKYMAQFVNDRYVSVHFIFSDVNGLKIPNSSIVTKDVYKIPVEYLIAAENDEKFNTKSHFNQKIVDENGEISSKVIAPTIYFKDNRFAYVNPDTIDKDAVLIQNNSNKTFSVITASTEKLQGVYCISRGTAVFKRIEIDIQSDDYTLIKSGTENGLDAYDRIALKGAETTEGEMIQ